MASSQGWVSDHYLRRWASAGLGLGAVLYMSLMPLEAGAQATAPAPTSTPDRPQVKPDNFTPDKADASAKQMLLVARPALYVHGKGRWDGGLQAIQNVIAKVKTAAQALGLAAAGPAQMVFLETSDDGYTYDAMLPLGAPVPAGVKLPDGILAGSTPAGKAVRFSHDGAYQDIDDTYEELTAWLDDRGLDTRNKFIEEYLDTAKDDADPALKVHIYVLLK